MIIVVGLGNPGKKYEETRHNIGFMIIDQILQNYGIKPNWQEKFSSYYYEENIGGTKVGFLKPQTYMNESGIAVQDIKNFFKVDAQNIWVTYDDLDLDVGKIRVKNETSSGGHNGIKSIDKHIGTKQYPHIKVGIGAADIPTNAYVTGKFKDEEIEDINRSIKVAAELIMNAIEEGEVKDCSLTI